MPDVIAKAVFEPGFGHYEIFGIFSRFRDRVYPCEDVAATTLCGGSATAGPNALLAYNNSRNAGGVGGNARVTLAKHIDFGLHALYGNGVGRDGTSGLPDATVEPNGVLAPLRSYQGLATLEWHSPKLDVYLNGGEEYVARRFQVDPVTGKTVGYGSPNFTDSNCYTETGPLRTAVSLSEGLPAVARPRALSRARSGSGCACITVPREEYSSARSIPTWSETHGTAPAL